MKKLILLSALSLSLFSCTETEKASSGIAPENDMCICTKEYMPVCGSDGVTYGNKCEAGCAKITSFTKGECK